MKSNKEKLSDAVGMLDEETVATAMAYTTHMQAARTGRRAIVRRRAAVLLAACLALTLVLSRVMAQFPLRVLASKSTRVESVTTKPNSLISRSRYSKNRSCF